MAFLRSFLRNFMSQIGAHQNWKLSVTIEKISYKTEQKTKKQP